MRTQIRYIFLKALWLVAILLSGFTSYSQQADSTDYEVYSSLLKIYIKEENKSVVLMNKTTDEAYYALFKRSDDKQMVQFKWRQYCENEFDSTTYTLINKFDKLVHIKRGLKRNFHIPSRVVMINSNAFNRLFWWSAESGWKKFYKRYQDSVGYFTLSTVLYSDDGKTAVLYYGIRRGELSGEGAVAVMQKAEKGWLLIHNCSLWRN